MLITSDNYYTIEICDTVTKECIGCSHDNVKGYAVVPFIIEALGYRRDPPSTLAYDILLSINDSPTGTIKFTGQYGIPKVFHIKPSDPVIARTLDYIDKKLFGL